MGVLQIIALIAITIVLAIGAIGSAFMEKPPYEIDE